MFYTPKRVVIFFVILIVGVLFLERFVQFVHNFQDGGDDIEEIVTFGYENSTPEFIASLDSTLSKFSTFEEAKAYVVANYPANSITVVCEEETTTRRDETIKFPQDLDSSVCSKGVIFINP